MKFNVMFLVVNSCYKVTMSKLILNTETRLIINNPLIQGNIDVGIHAAGNLPALLLKTQSDVADEQPAIVLDDIGGESLQVLQQGAVVQAPLNLNQVVALN